MTKESVIRYGRLYEIHRFHPKLKLRIMSEYTGDMPIYDASMNLRESPNILFMGICWVNDGYVIGRTETGIERHQKFTGHFHGS